MPFSSKGIDNCVYRKRKLIFVNSRESKGEKHSLLLFEVLLANNFDRNKLK